jgi:hypothetical protein
MLIQEIIQEYGETDVKVRNRKPDYDWDSMKDRQEREYDKGKGQGHGWYSGGQTNPRDPHEFVKKPHMTTLLDQDAYYKYIQEIRKLKKAGYHNPFFPQVYNVDITQDAKGNQRPRYRIEKLQPGEKYPVETLIGMYERLFKTQFDMNSIDSYSNKPWAIWSEIADQVNRAVERSNYTNIQDDLLIEALMLIDKIIEENPDWNVDLHVNNIRIRGSSQGPQLVLMDPISDGGRSIPDWEDVKYGPSRQHKPVPKYDSKISTFANMALRGARKPEAEPEAKKKTGLGTLLKRKLDQKQDQENQ